MIRKMKNALAMTSALTSRLAKKYFMNIERVRFDGLNIFGERNNGKIPLKHLTRL